MKKIVILLLFFSFFELASDEEKLRIYLCSRLTEAAKEWNNTITQELGEFTLFRPQDIDFKWLEEDEKDYAIYQADFKGMNESDLLLVLPPYGRDCAWEIGCFCGQKKPAIAYAETDGDWLNDAMVKGGLTAIITNNQDLQSRL